MVSRLYAEKSAVRKGDRQMVNDRKTLRTMAAGLVLGGIAAAVMPAALLAESEDEPMLRVYYLEIVTEDVESVCAAYSAAGGVEFGAPDPGLGQARTATMPDGSLLGVRAPLHEAEEPVVRPYWLVEDIETALAEATAAGGEVAHPPLEIPGHGTFAIYFLGGNQHGLWQR
jgi:predicted enzyme related to lactoylglutathione lyase